MPPARVPPKKQSAISPSQGLVVSLMGQENGHVNLVEWPPPSALPATEGQQLGLLNASFSV
jgi:hypothetical protein